MTPIERAEAELRFKRKELEEAEAQISKLTPLILLLKSEISLVEAFVNMAPYYESDGMNNEVIQSDSFGVAATTLRLLIKVIHKRGKCIPTSDLLKILERHSIILDGNDPATSLNKLLSGSPEFHDAGCDGWGLAKWSTQTPLQMSVKLTNKNIEKLREGLKG